MVIGVKVVLTDEIVEDNTPLAGAWHGDHGKVPFCVVA